MLLGLIGVTGVGKTHFVDIISNTLNFKKVSTIRTRPPRPDENLKLFMTHEELEDMYKKGQIAYKFNGFGGEYGYLKDEILSNDNYILEIHWPTIYDWKKVRPDIKTIYMLPNNIETAKEQLKNRHLPQDKEIERLKDMDDNYNAFMTDKEFASQFDYVFYNNYDEESEKKFIELVSSIM